MEKREARDELREYYSKTFPIDLIFRWFRYTKTREFSFTYHTDSCSRYITANSADELREKIEREVPAKIDAGAVYVQKPAMVSNENPAVVKELVFDVDLTDYKRACCEDKGMCNACLPLIKCAIEVLDHVLREHFGFSRLLFVFSGGRGVHCWVSDPLALTLTDRDRKNVITYLKNLKKEKDKKIDEILAKYKKTAASKDTAEADDLYGEIFPKIDENVTKQTKHLLKLPFCVHPRTKRVCVPIILEDLDGFQLEDVPVFLDPDMKDKLKRYIAYFENYAATVWRDIS